MNGKILGLILTLFSLCSFAETTSFPEPMVFDLMRGLDAKKGEVEVNSLFFSENTDVINSSPEVEFAAADGLAFELELPIQNRQVEAYKFGTQYTIFTSPNFQIGIQGIYEKFGQVDREDYYLTSIVDYKISSRFSFVGIIGGRSAVYTGIVDHNVFIMNLSLFYQIKDQFYVGVENDKNFYFVDQPVKVSTIPQVSFRINKVMRMQAGVGFDWHNNKNIQGFTRMILEF